MKTQVLIKALPWIVWIESVMPGIIPGYCSAKTDPLQIFHRWTKCKKDEPRTSATVDLGENGLLEEGFKLKFETSWLKPI